MLHGLAAAMALVVAGTGPPVQRPRAMPPFEAAEPEPAEAPPPDLEPPAPDPPDEQVEPPAPSSPPPKQQAVVPGAEEPVAQEPAARTEAPGDPQAGVADESRRDRRRTRRQRRNERIPSVQRRGFMVGVSIALTNCPQNDTYSHTRATTDCDENLLGPLGRAEIGYRAPKWLAVFASISYAYNGKDIENDGTALDSQSSWRVFDVGAGLMAFPSLKGRFDPYAAVMLGYTRQTEVQEVGESEIRGVLRRGLVRMTTGWNIFFVKRFAIGPRFDIDLPFAGQACVKSNLALSGDELPADCEKVRQIFNRAELDGKLDRRRFRRSFPTPWSLGAHLMGFF